MVRPAPAHSWKCKPPHVEHSEPSVSAPRLQVPGLRPHRQNVRASSGLTRLPVRCASLPQANGQLARLPPGRPRCPASWPCPERADMHRCVTRAPNEQHRDVHGAEVWSRSMTACLPFAAGTPARPGGTPLTNGVSAWACGTCTTERWTTGAQRDTGPLHGFGRAAATCAALAAPAWAVPANSSGRSRGRVQARHRE